ncbi:MAG: NAD-dependent epimerase/dehydratase family protein, partial [Candidatus Nanohaloarchaea archaeon]|nr:NAD-dependent epimerase/dehydratase family protein [Candidatus Nanohaloarchaea archaeon]
DLLVNAENHDVSKLVVASSMSNYGEGAYECEDCGVVRPDERPEEQMERGEWEQTCPECGSEVEPIPTSEDHVLQPTSIYAQTKRDQEEMSLLIGDTYRIDTVALRYFNVYGPRQSLDNPYTGVAAIFSSRIKNRNPPLIYEDGEQSRDFIHVSDIARSNLLVLDSDVRDEVINIGTGNPNTIRELAEALIDAYGADLSPEIAENYRSGDIRHCFADISKAEDLIGFFPSDDLESGIEDLVEWGEGREAEDSFEQAHGELEEEDLVE